jgi:hypothetical protein
MVWNFQISTVDKVRYLFTEYVCPAMYFLLFLRIFVDQQYFLQIRLVNLNLTDNVSPFFLQIFACTPVYVVGEATGELARRELACSPVGGQAGSARDLAQFIIEHHRD